MKVAIYARVSTDSDNQLNSLSNQQKYYIDYCTKNNHEMVHMYVDEGLTGTKLKREQFLNMMHDAGLNIVQDEDGIRFRVSKRKPKFEYIITKDVSRFARTVNAIQAVKMLRKKGVYVLFELNTIDTKDDKYEFMLNLFLNFAQQESIDRSAKVKFGLKRRADDGMYHFGSERLFGYQYDPETKKFSIVPNEVEIVKKAFNFYVNDLLGSRQISDIFNKEGYRTQNDHEWTANAIVRMLKQEKYTGHVPLLKYTYGDVTDENRPKLTKDENEWIYKYDILPPIIERETYEQAQKIMSSRSTGKRGINTPKNIFSKKIVCGKCGKNFIRSNQKQNDKVYYFYSCATRRRTKKCDNHSITLLKLEDELKPYQEYKLYEILSRQKKTTNNLIEANIRMLDLKRKIANKQKEEIQAKINTIESETSKLFDSFLNSSDVVKKAVERKIESFEEEKKLLEQEKLSYDESSINAEILKYEETRSQINKSVEKQKIFTLEEVLSFISKIVIEDEKIDIEFAFEKLLPEDEGLSLRDYYRERTGNMLEIINGIQGAIKNQ